MKRNFGLEATGLVIAFTVLGALCAATAQAQPSITCNNSAFGGGPITTYDFTGGAVLGSFVPTGASDSNNGRGVEVIGNNIYYTELTDMFGPTDFIRIAPFNGGAGGADIGTLPNPRPTVGVQDLAFFDGVLYAMTGYPTSALEVFGLNPVTGAIVSGPVSISAPAAPDSDGFTVLPDGNFLINQGDDICTYDEYNPTTGAVIPGTTIVPPGCTLGGLGATGVDTDLTSLFFQTFNDSFTQTTLTGTLIATQAVSPNQCEDISLDLSGCFGAPGVIPGKSNCHGKCVSFLAKTDGGMRNAASDLGYASVKDLQDAIKDFCGK
jgi:hypothetical protein